MEGSFAARGLFINPKHDKALGDDTVVSFVPMAAVSEITGTIVEPQTRTLGEVRKGYTHFADGDVIFAKITPCMENGKAASVRGMVNGLACGTTEFYVFRPQGEIDQDYLFLFVRQEAYRKAARKQMQSGVGQARVPKDFVLNTKIPLPPLEQQKRIVKKIESLQQRSRKARQALDEVKPLLTQFHQSVLKAAFSGELTREWRENNPDVEPASELLARIRKERRQKWEQAELAKYEAKGKKPPKNWQDKYKEPAPVDTSNLPALPEGWAWVPLELLATHQSGLAFKSKDFVESGTQVIKLGNLYQGRFDLSRDPVYITESNETSKSIYVQEGDILVAQTGTRHKRDYGHLFQCQMEFRLCC